MPGKDSYNRALYDALKKRLAEFSGKADKAFAEKFYFPRKDGQKGPLVRSVRLLEKQNTGVKVHSGNGIADNGEMVRVDVFRKAGKHYLVPIYVADMVKDTLPNKAIVANKPEIEWPEIDNTYEFLFSLFKNDLISINSSKQPENEKIGYYTSCNRANGAIDMELHDRSNFKHSTKGTLTNPWSSIGARLLKSFKKYQVDVLGNIYEVKKETRLGTRKMKCLGVS
ncbi:MAG TPA: hypothetical protein PLL10_03580 [Elusimicrobiales bacterium]|nr:hypothetical protein [Elusimicrobiales bacterium]